VRPDVVVASAVRCYHTASPGRVGTAVASAISFEGLVGLLTVTVVGLRLLYIRFRAIGVPTDSLFPLLCCSRSLLLSACRGLLAVSSSDRGVQPRLPLTCWFWAFLAASMICISGVADCFAHGSQTLFSKLRVRTSRAPAGPIHFCLVVVLWEGRIQLPNLRSRVPLVPCRDHQCSALRLLATVCIRAAWPGSRCFLFA